MTEVRLAADVLAQRTGDGLVLLDARKGQYFELNESAAGMLTRLLDGAPPADVATEFAANFEVTETQVRNDLDRLLDTLRGHGLLA